MRTKSNFKTAELDNFIDKIQNTNAILLASWLVSREFTADYNKVMAEITPQSTNPKIAEIIKIMECLQALRQACQRSDKARNLTALTAILMLALSIGADVAFTGGIVAIISLSLSHPVIATPTLLTLIAVFITLAPKLFNGLAKRFYKGSEQNMHQRCADIYKKVLQHPESAANLATLAKDLERGWGLQSRREHTIGTIILQAVNKIAKNIDHTSRKSSKQRGLLEIFGTWFKRKARPQENPQPVKMASSDHATNHKPAASAFYFTKNEKKPAPVANYANKERI